MKLDEYLAKAETYKYNKYESLINRSDHNRKVFKKMPISKIHNSIILEEAKLLKQLVNEDDIEKYFSVYHYLLWNGYFSYNNRFKYKTKMNEKCYNLALNISSGSGCCRNISVHFTKLINEVMKDNNFILIGTRYKEKIKQLPESSDIIMKKVKEAKDTKPNNIYVSTHMESFDNKNNIMYDPLNFRITRMNYDKISDNNFIGTYDLGIESIFGMDENTTEKLENLEPRLKKSILLSLVKKEDKTKEELIVLRDLGIEICKNNKELLKDHQQRVNEGYEYIYKKLNSK